MIPRDPWSAFEDELDKLDRARRKQQPVRSWLREECPAVLLYLFFCALHIVIGLVPWAIGMWTIWKWTFGSN